MLRALTKRIERALYARGYHVPEVRRMAAQQIYFLFAAVPALALGSRGVDFAAGVVLGTVNFLALARLIQELVYVRKGAVAVQMFSFYGRLALTALAMQAVVKSGRPDKKANIEKAVAYIKSCVRENCFDRSLVYVVESLLVVYFIGSKNSKSGPQRYRSGCGGCTGNGSSSVFLNTRLYEIVRACLGKTVDLH